MTQTWTPGPWRAMPICGDLSGQTNGLILFGANSPIGQVIVRDSAEQAQADARLIAAAPELYAALKDLLKASQTDEPDDWLAGWQAANAAIAKVRG